MSITSLKSLVVSHKEAEFEFPGFPDFKVTVSYLSRDTVQKLRKKATSVTYKNRQPVETVDDELFLKLYSEACVKGWTGLKWEYVQNLVPIDITSITDMNEELEFSPENALDLMKNSVNFDQFISETVTDLGNFTKNK